MTEDEIIRAVRWRYRVCNYLFRAGTTWIGIGLLMLMPSDHPRDWPAETVIVTGFGIFTSAFALTLAIYRCPVCDRYLSRFRPRKEECPHCGAKVRTTETAANAETRSAPR